MADGRLFGVGCWMLDVGCFPFSTIPDFRARKGNHAYPIKATQRHIADGGGDLAGEIEFAWVAVRQHLAEGHGLAGIEENAHGQFAFLLVELEEKLIEATEE